MGHGHGHGSASGKHVGRLWAALGLGATFLAVEVTVGVATGSLALVSDAAHMVTDVVGIGLALAAVMLAARNKANQNRTFGMYRAEVLAALANAVLLFAVAGYVLYEAIERFTAPPEVPGLPVVLTAVVGLAINATAFLLLREGAKESLNLRGAYLEVLSDLIGSVGVLISGLITLTTGWRYADPVIAVAIGLFVLPRTWGLAKRALRILFQHAPERVDVEQLRVDLTALDGVTEAHDVHVWTLTSGMEVASAHLAVAPTAVPADVLVRAQKLLADDYSLEHATVQVEPREATGKCRDLTW
ncbi:cation diffusion facilitator family transporter [Kutzneria sp. CA-103260]|uniref:cation diffusion facilitator family transporter n=1 Tax=Kutzneria sp. CA-103260 TaxID=2802641 RepID=UPI001BADB371|nr:cation diffusion facilitator family transporter [Kutzneria sp. CA-103260]QUQ71181.1 cation efflux system protein [Kutzneria sp. CA-103260]